MSNQTRVIGTTDAALAKAESDLGYQFPPTYRAWLKQNNGKSIEDITIFPVFDKRDPRKTWDSIVRNYNSNWRSWLNNFGPEYDFSSLLPFGEFGTGDYVCFDFSQLESAEEPTVVIWSHETGDTDVIASDFAKFVELAEAGELEY
jgi:cell wall assembly regulator SMI1